MALTRRPPKPSSRPPAKQPIGRVSRRPPRAPTAVSQTFAAVREELVGPASENTSRPAHRSRMYRLGLRLLEEAEASGDVRLGLRAARELFLELVREIEALRR